ncbi:hypothetical protein L7F22_064145 [Adiantum nelumboides]|nr:hypothetical protein [Adiantum nelumboides]
MGTGDVFQSNANDQTLNAPFLLEGRPHSATSQAAETSHFPSLDIPIHAETVGISTDTSGIVVIGTLRGATYKLLRFHLRDWIALLTLAIVDGVLNLISPFNRFVGKTMIGDLMYPLLPNTVPVAVVPVVAIVIPLIVFMTFFLFSKDITDLHHATLGLLFSVLITGVVTDAIKDATGRPRPDFFWRCFPDGVEAFNNSTGNVICHGLTSVVKEGYKSFPSGHTSWSFAGLGFLSLYLAGKLQLFNGRGHVAKVAIVFTPLLAAMLVGLSRVDDYWHHWQDVFAGAFLGLPKERDTMGTL